MPPVGPPLMAPLPELWICMDLEWTCDEGPARRVKPEEAEIIEFSYAIYDSIAWRVVCEGQHYCRNERTALTQFCTDLTGITEEKLAKAGTLEDALRAFELALSAPELAGRSICAVTHGTADLELALPNHCRAKGLEVPKVLRRCVDLREATQHYCAKSGQKGLRASTLRDICSVLGVDMLGNEHCGLDDSWMVLLAFQQLLKRGAEFQIVDLDLEQREFPSSDADRWLCLDGLAFYATAGEVIAWLESHSEEGGQIVYEGGLLLVLGPDGKPSGRALADFGSKEQAAKMLQRFRGGRTLAVNDPKYGQRERLVLLRPLRRQERGLVPARAVASAVAAKAALTWSSLERDGAGKGPLGVALVPFPADMEALHLLRNAADGHGASRKGKGKGHGQCYHGMRCTRPSCFYTHPQGFRPASAGASG